MKNPIKVIFVFLAIVSFLGLMLYFLGHRQFKELEETISPEELSQVQGFSPEQFLGTDGSEKLKEFVSQGGDFKIKYPADWVVMESKYQRNESQKSYETKYGLERLLLVRKFTLRGEFAQLIVSMGNFEEEISSQQIINEMKESNQEQGWEVEIINLEANENETSFEARYQKPDYYALYSQEKIIFLPPQEGKRKGYLVAIIAPEKDWQNFEEKTKQIIDSVEIDI